MRRVLNSFLQFIENDPSDSLIVCATNNPGLLDQALFRRFDDVLDYELPDANEAGQVMKNRLAMFAGRDFEYGKASALAANMSHADITRACDDAIKVAILNDLESVTFPLIKAALREKKSVRSIASPKKRKNA